MKLLALLIGLFVERLASQLFPLRRLRWLDRFIDFGFRRGAQFANWPPLIPIVVLVLVMVLPLLAIRMSLGDSLFGFPYLVLAVVVLFFSLGPKDIGEDVDEYCKSIEAGDEDQIRSNAKALLEDEPPEDMLECIRKVESSVYVQANNRLFAVIFWFVLLGPVGAWTYRATDLVRRRAVFNAGRDPDDGIAGNAADAAQKLHGWLAWFPARLTAIGYAMAGSFEGALTAWRNPEDDVPVSAEDPSESLLARVGVGATSLSDIEGESTSERGVRGAMAANGLVFRLLFIWAAVIAAMTLYGWSV